GRHPRQVGIVGVEGAERDCPAQARADPGQPLVQRARHPRLVGVAEETEAVDTPGGEGLRHRLGIERVGVHPVLAREVPLDRLGAGPRRPSLEAWISPTALATRAQRIRFGPLVSPLTFYHPAILAKMAAAVDGLSGGRLDLGIGAGWNVPEHATFGLPFPSTRE